MTIKHLLGHKYFYLFLAEIWTVVIAFLCLIQFRNLPSIGVKGADKYVHFTFYFVFTLLWFQYFNKKGHVKNIIFKIFISAFLYGVLIEIAQSVFTTTRQADVFDVLANTIGALVAIIIIFLYKLPLKNKI